jgi:hypothetical protein
MGSTLSDVYCQTPAIVSLLYVTQNGESAEMAVVNGRLQRYDWFRVDNEEWLTFAEIPSQAGFLASVHA